MGWKKSAGILALAIVTGWSIAGTVCAALCAPIPASTAFSASASHHDHHGSSHGAGHAESPVAKARFHVAATDGCGSHDAALLQAAVTVPDRAERQIVSGPSTSDFLSVSSRVMASAAPIERHVQPGNSPPPAFSPVLRV